MQCTIVVYVTDKDRANYLSLLVFLSLTGVAVLMCQSSKKEFYKKFLYEPLPVEVNFVLIVLLTSVFDGSVSRSVLVDPTCM